VGPEWTESLASHGVSRPAGLTVEYGCEVQALVRAFPTAFPENRIKRLPAWGVSRLSHLALEYGCGVQALVRFGESRAVQIPAN